MYVLLRLVLAMPIGRTTAPSRDSRRSAQLGASAYCADRFFRRKFRHWLRQVKVIWPECPAAIATDKTYLPLLQRALRRFRLAEMSIQLSSRLAIREFMVVHSRLLAISA
jgi:hypothetical protein